jgi:hypothetical protein
MRTLLATASAIASVALFIAGLLAPLTPSQGMPTAFDLIVYAALPALICIVLATQLRGGFARLLAGLLAAAIIAITGYLLALQAGMF